MREYTLRILQRLYGNKENGRKLEDFGIKAILEAHIKKDDVKQEEKELVEKVLQAPDDDNSMNFPKNCPFTTYRDGSTFTGRTDKNVRSGPDKGVYEYANGDKYDGHWLKNKRHGQGVMTYANQDKYDGDWVDGKRHGKGLYRFYEKMEQYKGKFENDEFHSEGEYTWETQDGPTRRFKGTFKNGKPVGEGEFTYANEDTEKREWTQEELAMM